ncbi:junctional adhesion molecule-like isoform X1 [Diceros bicornis minor]|uniref:junctional adhesion molecule-like isoform X1 n=2 Tax=Diceros bicornis minor TaxID=77932 RepID=UPI0026EE37CA|nr:junctional adhesion molecule-like isoform X1 [Diceros bicornis minor]XP_058401101.1 junctional adhesion molecule-like isoform X1 [Diceros bicornis minor]
MESSMFCLLKLILIPVLLDYPFSPNDLIVSSLELTVHEGDSALMGCVFQSTEEKRVTKVDWMVASGKPAKEDYVLYYYANLSVPVGRFQNRASLVGDILRNDGSLLLQNVEEADQGTYTCEIRLEKESLVFKKGVVLHVLPEEPKELTVHVGDSTRMGCVFQSTEEKRMTKVDWTFSSEEHAKEEIVLRYHPKLSIPLGYPQNWGRFQNRVNLVGDTSRNDGSILLQGVKESDRGRYTCSIHLGNLTFRKTIVLHVIPKEPQTLVTPITVRPEILGGNHLVTIVGIVCTTILLLPVLILIVKKTHRNKSSDTSTTLVKSLENTKKALPEKHIYSSISTREVIEEEEPSGKSEATYMTMHPVRPSLRLVPNNPLEKNSAGGMPTTEQAV